MIVYSTSITARLRYICDFIGKELTGKPFVITDNKEEFRDAVIPRINYSAEKITGEEFRIQPHSLLFEKGIREQEIICSGEGDQKIFFKTGGDLSFDVFASSFYLLSRYEEYLPHQKDMYGRYAYENSLAFRAGFLNIPLINIWLQYFKERLKQKNPSLSFQESLFRYFPTYDIDEAYSFNYKGWWRNTGAAAKDLLAARWTKFRLRQKVIRNKEKDPFDSYEWMDDLNEQYGLEPIYFFLVAEKTGKYDKNILPRNAALRALIWRHADKYTIGVHPSWQSGDDHSLIKKEKAIIEKAGAVAITSSRQHFIRFELPQTFRYLSEAGIKEDFSMGYGSINGFRASVTSPFYWYDLEKEEQTGLLLYPFCYMEANSFFEQKFSAAQALEEMRHYYKAVKKVNGTLITIWHNTFLGTGELFAGWREMYEQFIKEVAGQTETGRP